MFCHFLIDRRSHVGNVDWKGKLGSKHALTLGRKKQSEVHGGKKKKKSTKVKNK